MKKQTNKQTNKQTKTKQKNPGQMLFLDFFQPCMLTVLQCISDCNPPLIYYSSELQSFDQFWD